MAYLGAGIYTLPMAAKLAQTSPAKMRGWVSGFQNSGRGPLLPSDFERSAGRIAISFTNLVEALFVKSFCDFGNTIQGIRFMYNEAKNLLGDHPFAREFIFKTDGKTLYVKMLEKFGEDEAKEKLYNLRRRNWAMEEILGPSLHDALVYKDGIAHVLYPRKADFPNVVINPMYAFGNPVIGENGIPTSTLRDAVRAEGGNYETVAEWYEVAPHEVREATRFEEHLAAAA